MNREMMIGSADYLHALKVVTRLDDSDNLVATDATDLAAAWNGHMIGGYWRMSFYPRLRYRLQDYLCQKDSYYGSWNNRLSQARIVQLTSHTSMLTVLIERAYEQIEAGLRREGIMTLISHFESTRAVSLSAVDIQIVDFFDERLMRILEQDRGILREDDQGH